MILRCGECGKLIRATDLPAGEAIACPHCGRANVCPPPVAAAVAVPPVASDPPPSRSFPTRLVVGIAAIAAVAWAVWAIASASRAEPASPAASPVEARQKAILKDDLGKSGDPDLVRQYHDINVRYFAGRLPATPVLWEPRLAEVGRLGATSFTLEGLFGHIGDRRAILLNDELRTDPAAVARALCHEMVHAYLFELGDRTTDHGPAFQAELKRLADAGAFAGVVATDEERRTLKAWLDAENARLDAEGAAIERESDEIARDRADLQAAIADMDARFRGNDPARGRPSPAEIAQLNERRDAFNAGVEAAKARADQATAAQAEFNRQVARYNLMLVYPDGLDETRLVAAR